jgi:magnesium-transporting ATPase (P-type)
MITLYGQQFTKVNDSSTLTNLGQAEYMLLDKTGTLTTSYQKIDSILFGSNKYWVNHDNMFDSLTNPAKRGKTLEQEYHVNFEHEAGEVK